MRISRILLYTAVATCASVLAIASTPPLPKMAKPSGQEMYAANCADCHGAALNGTDIAPPLAGDYFRSEWQSAPLSELRDRITLTMPPSAPGSLEPEQYDAILNFILDKNGLTPDATEFFAN